MSDECPSCSSVGPREPESASDYRLTHWPIQIGLMGTTIPFLNDAELLVAADCTAFAALNFHDRFLRNNKVLIGCPKLDNGQAYLDKFAEIFANMAIKKLTCLRMEVPCCGGLTAILNEAMNRSGKEIPFYETIIGVKGDTLNERKLRG